MSETIIHTFPITEKQICDLFELDIFLECYKTSGDIFFQVNSNIGIHNKDETFYQYIKLSGRNFITAQRTYGNGLATITIYKHKTKFSNSFNDSTVYDCIVISTATEEFTIKVILEITNYIKEKNLYPYDQSASISADGKNESLEQHYRSISAAISNLAQESAQIINNRLLEIEIQAKNIEQEKLKEIQKERELLNSKQIDLEQKKGEFETRLSEINDRENTHVRRELYKEITKKISHDLENFSVSPHTKKYERTPNLVFFLFIYFLSILAAYLNYKFIITEMENLNLFITLKATTSTLGAVIAIGLYIRWRIRLYDRQAKIEYSLKQTQVDIARASWLVETLLEWRKNENGAIPNQLLTALSKNLFEYNDRPTDTDISAADQLASAIFGSAARLKLNAGPAELEIERKGIKSLDKQ